ncbi:ATPase [Aureococcus anophagefferens]|nr:ATPase [Aureococcus anophagefferens]
MSVAAAVAGGVRSGGLAMLAARSGSPGTACASRLRVDVDGDDAADVSACASLRTVGAALALARWNNFEGALRRADEGALDALSDRGASFDDPWFLVDCALPAGSACDDWDGNLDQGRGSVRANAAKRSGRWGVNFKTSDVQAAHSENNTIAENVFRDIGTATADTAALVADDGGARFNSTIRWNRMVNVMGGVRVVRGGGILETPASVVAFSSSLPTRTLWYGDDDALGYVGFSVYYAYGTDEERFQLFFNNSDLTPAGNWTEWLAAGKDRRSTIDAAPKFRDAAALDLCLEDDSPAFKLGFEAIPAHICAAVS